MIYLYDTLTRKKEEFKPLKKGAVSMYHCGPTVYDRAHVGNLRSFVVWDILRRVFILNGYKVTQVMNITDVDDKTIRRSAEEGILLKELTRRYIDYFLKDIKTLNVLIPHTLVRATDHIEDMVKLVEVLLKKGFAYKSDDLSIYFKISAFKQYGELAGLKNIKLKEGARISHDEYGKEDAQDFVLWKAWSEEDGETFWETTLGKGRPGWHIECSAMSMKYLGEKFDIHTGGRDLIFPHHTNEIAQSAGVTGKPFVHYWLHNEFVLVNGVKMAKSEENIIALSDIVERGFSPLSYRYFLLQAHYRTQINFTWRALRSAEAALRKLYEQYYALKGSGNASLKYKKQFTKYINDDLDTPQALSLAWQLMKDSAVSPADKKATLALFDTVLGLRLDEYKPAEVPEGIMNLVREREEARKKEDWETADTLRKDIEKLDYKVKDTPAGPQISKK